MKRFSILASVVLGLAAASHAGIEGFGWDNRTSEVVGRLGLGGYSHLEIGVGGSWEEAPDGATDDVQDFASSLSVSARYLLALHSWDKFTGYLHIGGYFRDDNDRSTLDGDGRDRRAGMNVIAGYEPEVVLFQHLAVSTVFGANLDIQPDMGFAIIGEGVSMVSGVNFRILF